jgi:plastocyanin
MNRALSRRAMLLAAGGGALLAAAATAPAQQPAPAAPNQITIDNFEFSPAVLTVKPGTKVVWLNHDEEPHTVMSTEKSAPFKSGALDTNDQFSFVFSQPGTYKYFCTIHSHMVGTVVVK